MWFLCAMYFCYGYCLAIYIVWFPTYLRDYRGFTLKEMGFYASLPLLAGTAGDLFGGWFSDLLLKRTGNFTASRRWVAFGGFLLATAGIIPATLTADAITCVIFTCIAVFGLETTVGVSWAVPLDIGGDFAGSASAVMNTCGNIGGTISPMAAAYLATAYGWSVAFLVPSVLCVAAAMLYLKIDAGRRIFPAGV
jgi:sugar phosphate permease